MKILDEIIKMDLIEIPEFTMDHFQSEILNNLHFEFFFKSCRVLVTPKLQFIPIGESSEEEENLLQAVLNENADALNKLKRYLIHNLSLYSALLESNSYYITLNDHLLISRFVPVKDRTGSFEVKLYTVSKQDLPNNYKDKLYLGRDFVSLKTLNREHFDLKHIRDSLIDQVVKLKERIAQFTPNEHLEEMEHEYLEEVDELMQEFSEKATALLESFPADLNSHSLEAEALIQANMQFRDLKHILIEVEETVREMESRLFILNAPRATRYVTKFKKDIVNDINYMMFKVNGRISDTINNIHI